MMHPVASYVLFVPMASTWIWMFLSPGIPAETHKPSSTTAFIQSRLRAPLFLKGLLPSSGIPLLILVWWYGSYGTYNMQYLHILRSHWMAGYRGTARVTWTFPHVPANGLWMARTSPYHLTSVLVFLAVVLSVALLLKGDSRTRPMVGWLVAAYFGIAVFPRVLSWQYGAFALPMLAAVLGLGVMCLPGRRARSVTAGAIIFSSLLGYSMVTFGVPRLPKTVEGWLGVRHEHCGLELCRNAPVTRHFPINDALTVVMGDEDTGGSNATSVLFAGPAELAPATRFALLRFYPEAHIQVSGVASPVFGNPFPFPALVNSHWIFYLTHPPTGNVYLSALARVFGRLQPVVLASYERVQSLPWPGGRRLVIYRRVHPVSVEQIDALTRALALPPRFMTTSSLVAAKVLVREGRQEEAIRRLRQAARIEVQPPDVRARILAQLARLLFEAGHVPEAERRAQQALSIVPWNPTARQVLRRIRNRSASR